MKMFSKFLIVTIVSICICSGLALAQNNMALDIKNKTLSPDGLKETFELYGSVLSGYSSANGWTSINYRADINVGDNNISAISIVANNTYSDGASGQYGNSITGNPSTGSSSMAIAMNREISGGGTDLVIGATPVLLGTVNITFNTAVSRTDVITPRSASTDPAAPPQSFYANGDNLRYSIAGSPVILPILLTSFTGVKTSLGNQLNWVASNLGNFSHFDLQRKTNGNLFATIASLNSTNSGIYTYMDADARGTDFYRLAMIDLDGSILYSATVAIVRDATAFTLAGIYPNPATNVLNIVTYSPVSTNVTYTITDLNGQLLKKETFLAVQTTTHTLDVTMLPKGNYVLNINANGTVIDKKFTKL